MSPIVKCFSITAFVFGFIIATSAQLKAEIILDTDAFSMASGSGGGFVVDTAEFTLDSADDFPNVSFLANFFIIDAGIEIRVNDNLLFSTGEDVSHFGPRVFDTSVGPIGNAEGGNIESPFGTLNGPTGDPLSRLTVQSDSTGTSFSGVAVADPNGAVESFTPNPSTAAEGVGATFSGISNFSSWLIVGDNTIEIRNLNTSGGANLTGDFTVTLAEPASVPEPNSLLVLLTLAGMMSLRRRRA